MSGAEWVQGTVGHQGVVQNTVLHQGVLQSSVVHQGEVVQVQHSRTSSSDSSADGLLLSVSALAGGGPGGGGRPRTNTTPRSPREDEGRKGAQHGARDREVMGQGVSAEEEQVVDMSDLVRGEPEGVDESEGGLASYLSVDKRLFGQLQEELTTAQSQLRLKEEQVIKLSRIRDDVESELEDLTASLFEEANKMVIEANVKRAQAEKGLAESEMKVDGLQTEVAALKTLVITSTPSQPNRHLHPHIKGGGGRGASDQENSAPSSPAKERSQPYSLAQGDEVDFGGQEQRNVDPVLRAEYLEWKKSPSMEQEHVFLARIYREDVMPCLDFPAATLADQVRKGVQENTLCLSPIRPDTGQQPRNCALLQQPRTCRYKLLLPTDDGEGQENFLICQLARNRITAVCDFLTYCRYVTQGMVKSPCNEVYWEVMSLRRQMASARLGFFA